MESSRSVRGARRLQSQEWCCWEDTWNVPGMLGGRSPRPASTHSHVVRDGQLRVGLAFCSSCSRAEVKDTLFTWFELALSSLAA